MNNYSWLEQKLHKFALSSQFMREVTFDFESTNITPSTETGNGTVVGMMGAETTDLSGSEFIAGINFSLFF